MPAGFSATFCPKTKGDVKTQILESAAKNLYKRYGPNSHALGNLLIELVLNKGKFKRELPVKKVELSQSDVANYDSGRHQQPTNGW